MRATEALEAARYLVYRAGFRHAPGALRRVERVAYGLRDRRLFRRILTVAELTFELVGWDEGFAADVQRTIEQSLGTGMAVREAEPLRSHDLEPGLRTEADIVMMEVPEWRIAEFAAEGFLVLPKRVTHLEELDAPESTWVSRLRRDTAGLRLSFDVTRSASELERFNRELYLPMVTRRHEARARPTSLSLLRLVMREGWLLRVLDGTSWVSGALVARHPTRAHTWSIIVTGVLHGDYESVPEAARTASVLFSRDAMRRDGARVCDHLVTRPFPLDGLFRRKRRWNTVPHDLPERPDRVVLGVRRDSPAVRRWFAQCPLLALSSRGLVGVASGALDIPGLVTRVITPGTVDAFRDAAREMWR